MLQRILHWTGGHPYLTQRLCRAVAEHAAPPSPAIVDRLCDGLFFTWEAREADDNLAFVRNRLLRAEVDLAALLDLYQQVRRGKRVPDDETNLLATLLKLSGVCRSEGGVLRLRNRIYERVFDREWVIAHMPDAELRRQRAAYRRGLVRAASVGAAIVAVVATLAVAAILAQGQARRQERIAKQSAAQEREARRSNARLLYVANMRLAEQAWERGDSSTVRQLLASQNPRAGEEDLRGFEWRYLWRLAHRQSERTIYVPAVNTIRYPRADRLFTTSSSDGTWTLWDPATGREIRSRDVLDDAVNSCIDPLGTLGLVVRRDGSVELFDLASWRTLRVLHIDRKLFDTGLYVSPDHRRLLSGVASTRQSPGAAILWDLSSGRRLQTLPGPPEIRVSAFSPDSRLVATGNWTGLTKVWEVATGRQLAALQGDYENVNALAFSPDGRMLAVGSFLGTVRLWDVRAKRQARLCQGQLGSISRMAFSPHGRLLAVGSYDSSVQLYEVASGRSVRALKGHTSGIVGLRFSPDGRTLVSAARDGAVKLWSLTARRGTPDVNIGSQWVASLSFSPDGKRLAVGEMDQFRFERPCRVLLCDGATMALRAALPGHAGGVFGVAFSPDGRWLATGSADKTVRLWEAGGRAIRVLKGHTGVVETVAFSPDGETIASGSWDQTVRLWERSTGRLKRVLSGHGAEISALAFSPDGALLAVTGGIRWGFGGLRIEPEVWLWEVKTGKVARVLRGHRDETTSVAFSPDGKTLATGGEDNTARLWDVASGRELATLRGHTGAVLSIAFSPDGRTVATSSLDRTVRFWSRLAGRELLRVPLASRESYAIAFRLDGNALAIGWYPGTVRVLEAATLAEVSASEAKERHLAADAGALLGRRARARMTRSLPPRATNTPSGLLDLSRYYNGALRPTWILGAAGTDLAKLPTGVQRLGGVPFDVRGLIQLGSLQLDDAQAHFPSRVTGIRIDQRCRRLHFLQATLWKAAAGTQIGEYLLHYADGSQRSLPILYGQQIYDWAIDPEERPIPKSLIVAWKGKTLESDALPIDLQLYRGTYANPLPDQPIESLDFIATTTASAPFLVAVTVE